jgi:copper(I)-binding protein
MPHLRLALAAGGLLLAGPALSSCGFDYPTERVNTVGAGVTDHGAVVDVGGALIVAGQPDSGTLIGTLSNNDDEDHSLISLTGGEKGEIQADAHDPVEVPARGHVNLAALAQENEGITVSGEFDAGDFVTVTLTFDNDESVTVEIPVMKPCYQFEGLDNTSNKPSTEPLYSCEAGELEAPAEH